MGAFIPNKSSIMTTSTKYMKAGLMIAAFGLLVLPGLTRAASYAYVDNGGDVKSVVANDWMTAIKTAFNIHIHSGVLLLDSPEDMGVVGDNVDAN